MKIVYFLGRNEDVFYVNGIDTLKKAEAWCNAHPDQNIISYEVVERHYL